MRSERIKELIAKATREVKRSEWDEDVHVYYTVSSQELDTELFAKLIVQECVAFISGVVEVHNQQEQDVCARAVKGLKNYWQID